ncbi:MAG: hypothetical protein JWO57_4263 [Pseudonocardiales bacterium]|nr:hypothetical protein [Pseudonocardiales bacterium]
MPISGTMCRVTVSSPTPRRVRAASWLDPRLVLGIVLVLGSVLVGARVVADARHTYRMLAANRDLAAGMVLTSADLTAVRVQLPGHGRAVYVGSDRGAIGKQLNRALSRGELLPASALGVPAARTTVTIPFAADAAPRLAAGQRVEVWLSTKSCSSTVLLADVTLQEVHDSRAGSFSSAGGQNVVVGVAASLAGRVVDALTQEGATIRAGVLSGPADPAANDALPDLSRCQPRTP